MNTEKTFRWLIPVCIVLITFVVFLPTLQNGFVSWDDYSNLVNNPNYRGLGWTQIKWMFTTFHKGPYMPLSWMSYAVDYMLWGMNPPGYHFTSLLLHIFNAVIFYFVVMKLLQIAMTGFTENKGKK